METKQILPFNNLLVLSNLTCGTYQNRFYDPKNSS